MADSMPAVSAQTPLQPGAAHGSSLVTPNAPMEASQPSMPGHGGGEMASGGSSNTMGWTGIGLVTGIHNGGQAQGERRGGEAWPDRPSSTSIAQDPVGAQTDMDVRVIDVPQAPHCAQSTGGFLG